MVNHFYTRNTEEARRKKCSNGICVFYSDCKVQHEPQTSNYAKDESVTLDFVIIYNANFAEIKTKFVRPRAV